MLYAFVSIAMQSDDKKKLHFLTLYPYAQENKGIQVKSDEVAVLGPAKYLYSYNVRHHENKHKN